ncbi:MAG: hypothetical protein QW117_01035 [Candidatus Pacearchaeota archaeon]
MNKTAIEKIMTIWWFFIWIIVIVGVISNIYIFTNKEIDYRSLDSKILNKKISHCLQNNYFNFSKSEEEIKKDILEICNLNNNTLNSELFSAKIEVVQENKKIILGPESMFIQCEIKEEANAINYPICVKSEINVSKENKLYNLIILTSSNAKGKRILLSDIK